MGFFWGVLFGKSKENPEDSHLAGAEAFRRFVGGLVGRRWIEKVGESEKFMCFFSCVWSIFCGSSWFFDCFCFNGFGVFGGLLVVFVLMACWPKVSKSGFTVFDGSLCF